MKKRYVIIGGSASGVSAAVRLRQLDENAQIVLFERESEAFFACCGIPYFLGGITSKKALMTDTAESFQQKYNIDVKTKSEVVDINRQSKAVIFRDLQSDQIDSCAYDKLILATGTRFISPAIPGLNQGGVFVMKTLGDMTAISDYIDTNHVRRAAVIGGSAIGIEAAENLARRGIKACVIEQSSHVLSYLDADMAQFASHEMENNGIAVLTATTVREAEMTAEGLRLELLDGRSVCVDIVIICAGVEPEVSLARMADLGIGISGGIIVDEKMQTTDKDIYAVGNAAEVECVFGGKELVPMASPAVKQGRVAADNICGINSRYRHSLNVAVVRLFDIDLAGAGLTETQLNKRNIRCEKIYTRVKTHETFCRQADPMTIKMLFEKKTGRILGVQIAGRSGVDKRIDIFAAAMQAGLSVDRIAALELGYTPPLGLAQDAVNSVCCLAEDVINGLSEVAHWNDFQHEAGLLLDVRTDDEYRAGAIPGALHIPLALLRSRLNELPHGRVIVVYSQYGQRGYMAERILKQHGITAKNLSGGYGLFRIFTRNG